MSDTLREAKVRVAEFVRQFSKLGDTGGRVHSVHTDPNTNAASLLSADLDAILAAHPADTETDLRCPHCGSELSLDYVFDGGSYSEYRSVDTIECDNWDTCAAEWGRDFKQTKAPKERAK